MKYMNNWAVFVLTVILVAGMGSMATGDPAIPDQVVLDDWDMLDLTFCPEGDINHTISFSMYDLEGQPISPTNVRLYFYNQAQVKSVVFCEDPDGYQSEYFYPTNDYGNHYTVTFGLRAGTDTSEDPGWLRMMVEWGTNYSESDMFPSLDEASPDLSGDLVVSLSDSGIFSSILYGTYDSRADYNHDGVISLADVGVFSSHSGDQCP